LTRRLKEQQNIIDEMSSAITKFLKVQPVVKEIQGNIEKTLESAITQGKFKVKVVNRDQSIEMVKSFTPDTIDSLEATIQNARDDAKACQQQSDTIADQIKRLQDALQEAHGKSQTEPWQLQHCRDIVNLNSALESLRNEAHQSRNQSLIQSIRRLDDKAASDSGSTNAKIQKASGRKLQKAQDANKPLKQQIIDSESECPSPKTPQTKRRHNDTTRQRRRISEKKADEIQRKPFLKENRVFRCKTIDINEADSAQWESLYGIGPYLAKRIITFRESLCGFVSVEQVKETYGLRDSVFQSIKTCLTIEKILNGHQKCFLLRLGSSNPSWRLGASPCLASTSRHWRRRGPWNAS
jgi:DNA uptake protein ComE-like DNA-binding protein